MKDIIAKKRALINAVESLCKEIEYRSGIAEDELHYYEGDLEHKDIFHAAYYEMCAWDTITNALAALI